MADDGQIDQQSQDGQQPAAAEPIEQIQPTEGTLADLERDKGEQPIAPDSSGLEAAPDLVAPPAPAAEEPVAIAQSSETITPVSSGVMLPASLTEATIEAPVTVPEEPAAASVVTSPEVTSPDGAPAPVAAQPGAVSPEAQPDAGAGGSLPLPSVRTGLEVVLVVFMIGLGAWGWTAQTDKQTAQRQLVSLKSNPQALLQQQSNNIIGSVSKLTKVPTDETPTVADVNNAGLAKQQSAFFKDAQDGDKVLMYTKARSAILYRPGTNRIVLEAPLTFPDSQAAGTTNTKK